MSDQKAQYTAPTHTPPRDGETRPLPEGWTKQFDLNSHAWFYVDTRASPPRSIWVHPYDDPQYLERHPDAKGYDSPPQYSPPQSPPPTSSSSRSNFHDKGKAPEKRGFLGKLKDKTIGTKEEREAAKRLREEERQQRLALQRAHAAQYGPPPQVYPGQFGAYPGRGYQQGQLQQGYGQPMNGQPARRAGFGGGGMALPLVGGLAGGLLLGEMIGGDGFGGDGGGFGGDGGDFGGGGGDFGGGDF